MVGVTRFFNLTGTSCLLGATLIVTGCQGMSPTYGTGKSSNVQLLEDVSNMVNLAPKRKDAIKYQPRPELVKPSDTTHLPEPQANASLAARDTGQWPESPEERRGRLRAYATENRDSPNYRPLVSSGTANRSNLSSDENGGQAVIDSKANREEYLKRKRAAAQGSATQRKYLSEPPTQYRKPAETAAADELGEDEVKKERRLRAESRRKAGKTSWRDRLPWK